MKMYLKNEAENLRSVGLSLSEIADKLNLSKSTISLWTKDIKISDAGLKRIKNKRDSDREKGSEILKSYKRSRVDMAEKQASELIKGISLDNKTTLIALAALYQCEGEKGRSISFTNSDPELVRAFVVMLKKSFQIDEKRLKINLQLHDYHDEKHMIEFWSKSVGIPRSSFCKTYFKKSNHLYRKEGYNGCARITYHNAHISRVIQSFAKKFINLYI
jgi:transcriptional regulator with XRE-family HTH domain